MSHATGKIEIAACTDDHIVLKYHQAANPREMGKVMVCTRNPDAYWFDDYQLVSGTPLYPEHGDCNAPYVGMYPGGADSPAG